MAYEYFWMVNLVWFYQIMLRFCMGQNAGYLNKANQLCSFF